MKKINPDTTQRKRTINRIKRLLILLTLAFIITLGITYAILRAVNRWFDRYELVFNKPVSVTIKRPIEIKERQVEVKEIVRVINEIPHPADLKTDTEKYIYEVFGIEDYKVAIAVFRAESGLREDAINVNTNGSVDVGVAQINSVHFKKEGCSLKEVATMKGNIDCAYKIYKASGWSPWVVFQKGTFLSNLKGGE